MPNENDEESVRETYQLFWCERKLELISRILVTCTFLTGKLRKTDYKGELYYEKCP